MINNNSQFSILFFISRPTHVNGLMFIIQKQKRSMLFNIWYINF